MARDTNTPRLRQHTSEWGQSRCQGCRGRATLLWQTQDKRFHGHREIRWTRGRPVCADCDRLWRKYGRQPDRVVPISAEVSDVW